MEALKSKVFDSNIIIAGEDGNFNARKSVYKPDAVIWSYEANYVSAVCDPEDEDIKRIAK